jgi:hypothetical protein
LPHANSLFRKTAGVSGIRREENVERRVILNLGKEISRRAVSDGQAGTAEIVRYFFHGELQVGCGGNGKFPRLAMPGAGGGKQAGEPDAPRHVTFRRQ